MMTVPKTGRTVVRALEELRTHPALDVIGSCAFLPDLNEAARSPDQSSPEEPIFVTQAGLILAGFGRWRLALSRKIPTIECVEYCLTEEDALQFMLAVEKRRNGWNSFIRIRLALNLERPLQQRALINMQMGGKHKGSATLPKAAQIDVREQIAAIAGAGARNVSKVKEIIEKSHPRILGELASGSISINRAHRFCRLPFAKQLEALTEDYCDKVADDIERGLFRQGNGNRALEVKTVLNSLQQQELQLPGSVSIHLSRRKRSVILVGEDFQSRFRGSAGVAQR